MAIDTAAKRGSALLDAAGILFPPDGAITAPDRLWLLGQYSGIAAGVLVSAALSASLRSPSAMSNALRSPSVMSNALRSPSALAASLRP